jgi:hypothetical protein
MVNSTAVSCGLSAAISAGDFPVQVSLNGQQFHDSSVQFHFTPVIFSLAGPPVGSDTGGSEVLIRGFGLSNVELLDLSQILCKFGDIETVPAASISDNGDGMTATVTCVAPELPQTTREARDAVMGVNDTVLEPARDDVTGLYDVTLELSVDNGAHFSSVQPETNPCACWGPSYRHDTDNDDCRDSLQSSGACTGASANRWTCEAAGSCTFTAVGSTTAFEAATCTTTPQPACSTAIS